MNSEKRQAVKLNFNLDKQKANRRIRNTHLRKADRHSLIQNKRLKLMTTASIAAPQPENYDDKLTRIKSSLSQANRSPDDRIQHIINLREILANPNQVLPIGTLRELGIVPLLIPMMNDKCLQPNELLEALWCLTNFITGSHQCAMDVVPAIPKLIDFLKPNDSIDTEMFQAIVEQSAWAIGNMAADSDEVRAILHDKGVVAKLVEALTSTTNSDIVITVAWSLSNLARGVRTSSKLFVEAGAIPPIFSILQRGEEDSCIEVAWMLSFLTAREEEFVDMLLGRGIVPYLVEFLRHKDPAMVIPILRVLGNMSCEERWCESLLKEDQFVPNLLLLLADVEALTPLLKETMWVISNMAAQSSHIVDRFASRAAISRIATCFRECSFDARREASFALANIGRSTNYLPAILAENVLSGFLDLLSSTDLNLVCNSLDFIENVLRNSANGVEEVENLNGIELIENLHYSCQFQPRRSEVSVDISAWSQRLMDEFYGEEYGLEEKDESVPIHQSPGDISLGRGRGKHMTKPSWA